MREIHASEAETHLPQFLVTSLHRCVLGFR